MSDFADFGMEDLERVVRDMGREGQRLADIEGALKEVYGTGKGAGGLISVTTNGSGQVEKIDLSPRVMRLDSHELAAELMKAIGEAKAEGERKTRELMSGAGISVDPPDLEELQEQLTATYETFARSMADLWDRPERG